MGAVRPKPLADPTEPRQPLCQPASAHRWEERKREWIGAGIDAIGKRGNVSYFVTWRCRLCKTVITVRTRAVNWRTLMRKLPKRRASKLDKRRSKC